MSWLISLNSLAATSVTSVDGSSRSALEKLKNKTFEDNKRISDLELKAQAGSLSRYSLKFDLVYSGPPVDNLSDPERPNPDNRPGDHRTSLAGFTGLRYRLSSESALSASTGFTWFAPYQATTGEEVAKRPGAKDFEMSNARLAFDKTYSIYDLQMRSSLKGSWITQDFYTNAGQYGAVGATQAVKAVIGQTRLTLGASLDFDYYLYEREYEKRDRNVSNYYLSMIPSMEYKILDNLNFRTSLAYSFTNFRASKTNWLWNQQRPTQRLGLGWGITRDIYFNPYLNFFPDSPAIETTSASFTTVFSIF